MFSVYLCFNKYFSVLSKDGLSGMVGWLDDGMVGRSTGPVHPIDRLGENVLCHLIILLSGTIHFMGLIFLLNMHNDKGVHY